MRLLKIIAVAFIIYFVRRFFQLYRTMKKIQELQTEKDQFEETRKTKHQPTDNVINADFKVVD